MALHPLTLYSLYKIVPQNACRILQHSHESCNLHFIILNRRSVLAVGRIRCVQLSQIDKSSESPITFFSNKSVMRV